MSDKNKENIENNQEENQNKSEVNRSWWKNVEGLKSTYKMFYILFLIFLLIVINNIWRIELNIFKFRNYNQNIRVTKFTKMKEARAFHNASFLSNDEILITGGFDNRNGKGSKTTEILNIKDKSIKMGPDMNLEHYGHVQITTKNGDIYIIDTNGIELLSIKDNSKFNLISENLHLDKNKKSRMLYLASAVLLPDDNILAIIANTIYDKPQTYLVNTKTKSVKQVFIENNKIYSSLLPLKNGKVLFFGGTKFYARNNFIITETLSEIGIYNYLKNSYMSISDTIIDSILPFVFYEERNKEIIIFEGLFKINNVNVKDMYSTKIKILDSDCKLKKEISLNNKFYTTKHSSEIFKINNKKFLSFLFSYDKSDYKIDSYINVFDLEGNKQQYNTYLPPFSKINQISNTSYIVSGGDEIKNNHKFNYFLKHHRKLFCSTPYINDSFLMISGYVIPSKSIYLVELLGE